MRLMISIEKQSVKRFVMFINPLNATILTVNVTYDNKLGLKIYHRQANLHL